MLPLIEDAARLVSALGSNDAWTISNAMRGAGAWLFGAVLTAVGGGALALIYHLSPLVDRYFERTLMVSCYLLMAGIIFVEVFRRFVLNEQAPWSTTLPPFLFLILTWFGCAYNVRLRTHLAFSELRMALPRLGQFACLCLDHLLWLVFCWIVVVTSLRVVANSASNFQILLGTDNIMQWWLLTSVPLSFIAMAARTFENAAEDITNLRRGRNLISPQAIGAD
ncbi:TRAP transporter small permease [Algihabitans albus]|uniref:TRAP transporter small permease n=1 Tax=Algihabitans albus TaxID=2164067 RepID=UPI000E5CFFAF|nr:TRAP transporter small permease subunit [Algihabitans albus]